MIIRRIAHAMRRQDWYAVAIEFSLVVIGVLVALQLDTWAQHRADKFAYAEALDRLRAEISANLEIIELVEEEIASELPVVRSAFDALETCSDDPDTFHLVNQGLGFISGTSGLAQRDSALKEVTSTPRLLALQSPQLRHRLADLLFYAEIVKNEASFYENMPLQTRPERIPVLSPGPWTERKIRYHGIDFTGDRRLLQLNVPVSTACRNTELVAALWAWLRWQSNLPILISKMREEYRLTLELIDQENGP